MNTNESSHTTPAGSDNVLYAIAQALDGLRYGQVTIIVQNGRVMQIDRTDRKRLNHSPEPVDRVTNP